MPKQERQDVFKRARKLGLRTYHFYRQMEKIFGAADIVVSMGGYNTLCELLSLGTVSLIIPRETPRKEQLIRARILNNQHLVDYVPLSCCSAPIIREKIFSLLENSGSYRTAISRLRMTGIDEMRKRLYAFSSRSLPDHPRHAFTRVAY